jgi:predicted DsbA family dithiol-disulfide isomerase
MELESTIKQAKELGIRRVPAIVVDGKIADCCAGAVNEQTLRNAGIGSAI